jgi:hypothetical protein
LISEFSESVGLALTDMLAELHPVLAHASTGIWIAGLHSQTEMALAHPGATDGSSPLVVHDQVDEAEGIRLRTSW